MPIKIIRDAEQSAGISLRELRQKRTPGETFVSNAIGTAIGEPIRPNTFSEQDCRILEVPNGAGSIYGIAHSNDPKCFLYSLAYAPCSGIAAITVDNSHFLGHAPPGQLQKLINVFVGTGKHSGASVVFFGNNADSGAIRNIDQTVFELCRHSGIFAMPQYLHKGGHRAVDALVTSEGLILNIAYREREVILYKWADLKIQAAALSARKVQQDDERIRAAKELRDQRAQTELVRQRANEAQRSKTMQAIEQRKAKEEEVRKMQLLQRQSDQHAARLAEQERQAQVRRHQEALRLTAEARHESLDDAKGRTTRSVRLLAEARKRAPQKFSAQ